MKKGKREFVDAIFANVNLRSDIVHMVESYVDHERAALLSGGFKQAWSPPAVMITKTMRRDFALQKSLKDFYPMEVWHKYDIYSHIRDISTALHFTFT